MIRRYEKRKSLQEAKKDLEAAWEEYNIRITSEVKVK